ncbi:hypothetical protein N7541_000793 [Penicillium brevicompactum]|uniref:Uncharacterized protein n=1 Tax=Penicillium brevicompactum TaxID=5074 RepID=A0A9W9V2Y9_PENBR|nr:hypothetical protein N7541_000793 [Penicillium brevicompactum]
MDSAHREEAQEASEALVSPVHSHEEPPNVNNRPTSLPAEPHPEPANEPLVAESADESQKSSNEKPSIWKLVSDLFIWEVLAMILSSGLLVAIVVLLSQYDDKPQPTWKYVSLNSVISWLSTISKGCVLFCLSEGIGQLKWVWFTRKTQPLVDLGTFDGASRGIWGCGALVWRLRAKHFAALGSLAVILALAFDPFIQNLIHYYPKLIPDPSGNAVVASNSLYSALGPPVGIGDNYVNAEMKANVYNALFNSDTSQPWATPRYTCTSGNCTWDPVAALEMRASCTNITDKLKYKIYNGTLGIVNPNTTIQSKSIYLTGIGENLTADVMLDSVWGQPVALGVLNPLVYNKSIIPPIQLIAPDGVLGKDVWSHTTDPDVVNPVWQAMECSVEPIVRSFRPSVAEGHYSEDTIDTWTNGSFKDYYMGSDYSLKPPWGPEKGVEKGKVFTITKRSLTSIRYFFQQFFPGRASMDPFGFSFISDSDSVTPYASNVQTQTKSASEYASGDLMQLMAISNITLCPSQSADKLKCAMENVAKAMSKAIRDQSSSPTNLTTVSGEAMTSSTHISIHWQWIILPAVVWLLGLVTLLGTMWKTRRTMVPTWKNETMPIIALCRNSQNEKPQSDQGLEAERAMLYKSDGKMVMCGQCI